MANAPVIVCGLGRVGRYVLEYLRAAGLEVVAIEWAWPEHESVPEGVRLVRGDCRQRRILEAAGVANARGVMILTNDDLVNISTALTVRSLHPDVRIVLRMFNQNLVARLGQAVRNVHALSTSALVAPLLATIAASGEALAAFETCGERRQIIELLVKQGSPWIGRTIATVARQAATQVVAHLPRNGSERLLADVDAQAVLEAGDQLVLCGDPRACADLLTPEGESLPVLVWASRARRFSRVVWNSLSRVDLAVKVALTVFILTVLASTFTYHFSVGKTWPEALFRTISIMGTATDMHGEELTQPWQLVFASLLRIVGAALVAAFTAIIVNFLLRIRLEGALEAGRIPEGGHVVVCGLSNVGFRMVEELRAAGMPVVALELQRDNRFVHTLRRQRLPVIIGDATVPQTLALARAQTARALVAATSDELANLEIALLAREANPRQRIIVLLNEPRLAKALREASDIRYALSMASLSAPAFMAALYCDAFRGLFLVAGKPLAVVEFTVQADEALLNGQSVRALATDFRMLPVGVAKADGAPARDVPSYRLGPSDRLTAVLALKDLERLLRRQPSPANWAVDVTGFPLPTRPWVVRLLRSYQPLAVEEAEAALNQLPARIASGLTRGQAEDLLAVMQRERVSGAARET